MSYFGEKQHYESALQSLKARRIVLVSSTSFGIGSAGDDDYGRYEEEVGLFPQDRRLLHGVSWIIKRSGLRQRAHRWLTFAQVGSVWVYHWTNRPDGIRFSFGPSGFNVQGGGLRFSMDTSEHRTHQRALDHEEPDRYWVCLGEFRLFGPFYRSSYASDLAGHVGAELGLPCDTTPRREPRRGQIAEPGEGDEVELPQDASRIARPRESEAPEPQTRAPEPPTATEPVAPDAEPGQPPLREKPARSLPRPPSYRQMRSDPTGKKKR